MHPRLTHRAAWLDHDGDLPVIEGTLIRLQVDHLPGDRDPKPVWLWSSATGAAPDAVDRLWQDILPPGEPRERPLRARCTRHEPIDRLQVIGSPGVQERSLYVTAEF